MTFSGWSTAAVEFFAGLEADNSKSYWLDHKPLYDAEVRAPMEALLAELEPEFGEGKIFRPNRDIRFSNDKSPYKTAIGATLPAGGYVQFSAAGLMVGAGMYQLAPDQLERYRAAVDAPVSGAALVAALVAVESSGATITGHDSLKTAPRGFAPDHPRAELLRHKGLTAGTRWPVEPWLGTPDAEHYVLEALRAARPLVAWLKEHVGSSRLARR